MNTINVNNAPVAPAYVADLWQIESNVGYLRFKFKSVESANLLHEETKVDPEIYMVSCRDSVVTIHYKNQGVAQIVAKALNDAYNIEVIGLGFREA